MRLRSPILWFGGKGNFRKKTYPYLPKTKSYVEPFGGGASVLMGREPSEIETYNDLDGAVYDLFTVLADPELFEQFYRRVSALPYSRRLFLECREGWQAEPDRIKRVSMWYVVARQAFSGDLGSGWGFVCTSSRRGMAAHVSKWLTAIDNLPEIHKRLSRVQIENSDFRNIFQNYDTQDTLFYCDPPYVLGTRKKGGYSCEMSDQDHADLVDCLLGLSGMAVLSGYNSGVYDALEQNGWIRKDFETACYAAGRTKASGLQGRGAALEKQARVESLWICPKTQKRLQMPMQMPLFKVG